MTTLIFKRNFCLNKKNYLYKVEQTAANEIQKTFGEVAKEDMNNHLDFLPKEGIVHKLEYDSSTRKPYSFEIMKRKQDNYGLPDVVSREKVAVSTGKFPYWVTLQGNGFETSYVKTEDAGRINAQNVSSSVKHRIYENKPIGYDKTFTSPEGDVLEYSYFPNSLNPCHTSVTESDVLSEETIIKKAGRLINRFKKM